jgi:ABC-type branched-subunit amino acid transport system substrate-binding protein
VVAAVPHQEVVPSAFEGGISYINELQEAAYKGNPEVLIVISYPEHAKVYLREAIENNLFKKFLFAQASRHHLLIDAIGAENLEGMCGTAPGGEETESTKNFIDSYKAEYGEAPTNLYQRHMYDAVFVAGLAAYAAQANGESITPITIRDYLRRVNDNDPDGQKVIPGSENLKRAMKMLDSGLKINYEGASGNVDFDENGDVITPIEIWCFEGGEIVHKENKQPDI